MYRLMSSSIPRIVARTDWMTDWLFLDSRHRQSNAIAKAHVSVSVTNRFVLNFHEIIFFSSRFLMFFCWTVIFLLVLNRWQNACSLIFLFSLSLPISIFMCSCSCTSKCWFTNENFNIQFLHCKWHSSACSIINKCLSSQLKIRNNKKIKWIQLNLNELYWISHLLAGFIVAIRFTLLYACHKDTVPDVLYVGLFYSNATHFHSHTHSFIFYHAYTNKQRHTRRFVRSSGGVDTFAPKIYCNKA